MERVVKYCIYLHAISYGGENIGDDLTFTIKVEDGSEIKINPRVDGKPLSHGKAAKGLRKLVIERKTRQTEDVTVNVGVVEKDKVSDPGSAKKEVTIDLKEPFGQEFLVDVEVKAVGGDAPRKAKFTLKFGVEPPLIGNAKSVATTAGSKFKDPATNMDRESAKEEIEGVLAYAKQYDGPTEFYIEYRIVLNDKGALDTDKSRALFKLANYTFTNMKVKGATPELRNSTWETFEIPITKVTFADGDNSKVESFQVKADKWYPKIETYRLENRELVGTVDIKSKKVSYIAKHFDIDNGVITTFKVDGTLEKALQTRPKDPVGEDGPPFVRQASENLRKPQGQAYTL